MISYQHLEELRALYLEKALGTTFCDPIVIEAPSAVDQAIELPQTLEPLHQTLMGCHLCDLSKSRSSVQAGFGSNQAELMIINDYPSLAEDSEGAYSGKTGKMLEDMITQVIGLEKEEIFYTHAVKCMPLNGKQPTHSEVLSCKPFLQKQIDILKPKLIVALGEISYNYLTADNSGFEAVRGEIRPFGETQLLAMYHPRHLRANPSKKKLAMSDLIKIKSYVCAN
ncbi:MAG: uracil-DNA glycosylase [Thiovulaceae bacterium]|nr:uracil-DNA glycosylase [Sulfurimonadaceae bacterium]